MKNRRQHGKFRSVSQTGTVTELGDRGDGVLKTPSQKIYVPGALADEEIRYRLTTKQGDGMSAALEEILRPSPDRVNPPCPHAPTCGGCDLQHMNLDAQLDWKRNKVVRALSHRGLGTDNVGAVMAMPGGTRRRLSVALRGRKHQTLVGFFQRSTHTMIDTPGCLLPTESLSRKIEVIREYGPLFLPAGEEAKALLTETETGIDMVLDIGFRPELAAREGLAQFAEKADLARLSLRIQNNPPEPLSDRRTAQIRFGGQKVFMPQGAFLQPSREGETALQTLVAKALADVLKKDARIFDLFCGLGTFSLPLKGLGYKVTAFDLEGESIRALERSGVDARTHDLFRNPLEAKDLAQADAVVLDPPRAGALAQCREIADNGPAVVVMVSCSPGTFSRDARLLTDGGYTLDWVTPVDQFIWSHHVEVVARFTRG